MSRLSLAELETRLSPFGAVLVGDADAQVSGITEDSRRAGVGSLFVARRGARFDGTAVAHEVLARGAAACLCRKGTVEATPRIEVDDLARAFGVAAHAILGEPSHAVPTIGITGTNGKTTTSMLVDGALTRLFEHRERSALPAASGSLVGRIGTLGFFLGDEKVGDTLTTPLAGDLAADLALARERGARAVVMEVSSHALDQARVFATSFRVAALTNFSQDHLDYHGSLEAYGAAKERLFFEYEPQVSVINLDDEFGARLAARLVGSGRRVIGVCARRDAVLDGMASRLVRARTARFDLGGIVAEIEADGERATLESRLVGRHNLENLLVALGVLVGLGFGLVPSVRALSSALSVPGRLERVDEPSDDLLAVVDYAHTPDAIERVLDALREVGAASLVCVFGCGGDRDRKKRPLMGRAVAERATEIWLTSDNPRTENPEAILADVRPGLLGVRATVHEELDRRSAIREAVLGAPSGSVVAVLGKGHETAQIVGTETFPFDDRVEVRAALTLRREARS